MKIEGPNDPIFPPGTFPPSGHNLGGRRESANLNIEELGAYLESTSFENSDEITEFLSGEISMTRHESMPELEAHTTQVISPSKIGGEIMDLLDPEETMPRDKETIKGLYRQSLPPLIDDKDALEISGQTFKLTPETREGIKKIITEGSSPVSGHNPEVAITADIRTRDQGNFHLQILRVYNRNEEFRYEYILTPLP